MKSKNLNLNKARKSKNDEFYTKMEDVKFTLDIFKYRFVGKKIICPCDGLESEFYIYLKENGFDVTVAQRYEDVDYSKFDICITNPPFSKVMEFTNIIIKSGIEFLYMIPLGLFGQFRFIDLVSKRKLFITHTETPSLEFKNGKTAPVCWVSSFQNKNKKKIKKKGYIYSLRKYDNYNALEVSKLSNLPETYSDLIGVPIDFLGNNDVLRLMDSGDPYDGLIGVPSTFLAYYDVEDYDIIDHKNNLSIDGKTKFARIIIRKKGI